MSIITKQELLNSTTNSFQRGIIKKFLFGSDFKCSTYKCKSSINVGKSLLKNNKPWLYQDSLTGIIKIYENGICLGINNNNTVYFNGASSTEKVTSTEGFIEFCKEFSTIEVDIDNLLVIRNKLNDVIIEWNNLLEDDNV